MKLITDLSLFTSALDPPTTLAVRSLLRLRVNLAEDAWFYIVEPGDGQAEVVQALGFSLLSDLTGDRPAPSWEWAMQHGTSCLEVAFIFTDDFAHILIVPDSSDIDQALIALFREGAISAPQLHDRDDT